MEGRPATHPRLSHRVEVASRDWAEGENQRCQPGTCSDAVGEQRNRYITASESLTHDSGANDDGEQKCRAQRFGNELAGSDHNPVLPISLTFF
jgi:hypothetical protein